MQPQADPFIVPLCLNEIQILFEDEHILVINKPSGLLSLSGKHPLNIDSVHHRLAKIYPGCTLIHRLDFGTSGIMILARNKVINALLCKQFSERRVSKRYTALLQGTLENDSGIVDIGIAKDSDNFPLMKLCEHTGKPARSQFRVLKSFTQSPQDNFYLDDSRAGEREVTKVEYEPITGRTHQLRLHSQHIGHPILGCDLYANDEAFFMTSRLMLHASQLTFDHPITNEAMTIKCNSPF